MNDPAAVESGSLCPAGSDRRTADACPLTALIGLEPHGAAAVVLVRLLSAATAAPVEATPAMVVAIDEKSLAAFGQWPWPRTLLAELIRDIEQYQPLAIGVDILMPEADRLSPQQLLVRAREKDPILAERLAAMPSNDAELAAAIGAGPVVLGLIGTPDPTDKESRAPPFEFSMPSSARARRARRSMSTSGRQRRGIEELDSVATGHGLISVTVPGGIVRRMPLVSTVKDRLMPSLPIEMLRVALHEPEVQLHVNGLAVTAVSIGTLLPRPRRTERYASTTRTTSRDVLFPRSTCSRARPTRKSCATNWCWSE